MAEKSSGPACQSHSLPPRRGGKHTRHQLGTAPVPVNSHPMCRMTGGESCVAHAKTKPKTPPATRKNRGLTHLPRSIPQASPPSCSRCHRWTREVTHWQKHHGIQALWLAAVTTSMFYTIFLYHINSLLSIWQSMCLFYHITQPTRNSWRKES